jgi:tetratricopeptide (TPR) repeat protein
LASLPETAMPDLGHPSGKANLTPLPRAQENCQRGADDQESQATAGPMAVPAYADHPRSEQLEQAAQEADRHSRRGFDLAGRGACFAARAEFIVALRVIAQGLDAEYQTGCHSRALSAGLTAIRESDDFIAGGSRVETELSVGDAVRSHLTPVLKGADFTKLTPGEALKCYLTFAQEQLALSAASEVAGSMALHGLGKLYAALATQHAATVQAAESKSMVCYQAALLVCPKNYLSSNDLGVILGRGGHYAEARIALEHSVSVCQQSANWHNLAVVYGQLGDADRAHRAELLSVAVEKREHKGGEVSRAVDWLDSRAFAESLANTQSAMEPLPVRGMPEIAHGGEGSLGKPMAQAMQNNASQTR